MKRKFDRMRLIALRKERGLSGEKLGDLVSLTQGFISALERGEKSPSIETVGALASALGTSMAYLLGETDNPRPAFAWDESEAGWEQGAWSETDGHEQQPKSANVPVTRKSQASADLDTLIRDMAAEHPDLIVLFRDTRERWEEFSEKEKRAIADGMAFVLGRADADIESRLRKEGRKGPI